MKFIWNDKPIIGDYELRLVDDDGEELQSMWLKDHTAPWCVENDEKDRYYRDFAYEAGYCHGFSMQKGFDKDESGDDHYGYHGKPVHTVDDIKRWCENYIAQMYLRDYQRAIATLDEKRRRSEWFEAQGFVLESGEGIS